MRSLLGRFKAADSSETQHRKLQKENPNDTADEDVPRIKLIARQDEVDPRKAADLFRKNLASITSLWTDSKTHDAVEGFNLWTIHAGNAAAVSGQAKTDLASKVAQLQGTVSKCDLAKMVSEITATVERCQTSLTLVSNTSASQHLLTDPAGSKATEQRQAIGKWIEKNLHTLDQMSELSAWADGLPAKMQEQNGKSKLDIPGEIEIHFRRMEDDIEETRQGRFGWRSSDAVSTSICPMFTERKGLTASDRNILERGDATASYVTEAILDSAKPGSSSSLWRPVTAAATLVGDSLYTAGSTLKNIAQSFGARHFPALDFARVLWPDHEEGNKTCDSSILSELRIRCSGVIPRAWGWELNDPIATVNLKTLREVISFVDEFRGTQVTRTHRRSIDAWLKEQEQERRRVAQERESERLSSADTATRQSWWDYLFSTEGN